MAVLDPTQQQGGTNSYISGLLNNPMFLAGLSILGQNDESVAQVVPTLLKYNEQNAMNQYRQQQAKQQAEQFQLEKEKYAYQQQQDALKIKRAEDARKELANLRGFKGQTPEQAGAIFKPDSQIYTGSGYEGGQLTPEQFRLRQAEIMMGMGDTGSATNLYDDVTQPFTLSPGQTRMDAQGNVIAQGAPDKNQTIQLANKLRDEYTNISKPFRDVNDAWGRIQAAGKLKTAAGDVALIYGFMKINDPGSTVREGEFATAQNSAGVPERVRQAYNMALSGQRLTDQLRADFLNTAGGLYQAQLEGQQQIESQYTDAAKRAGLNPEDVVINYRVKGRGDQQRPQYTEQQLSTMAEQAIAAGADRQQVQQRLNQLRGNNG